MDLVGFKYSIPYLLIFLFYFLLSIVELSLEKKGKGNKITIQLCIVGFFIFFSLRGWAYADWLVYHPYFETIPGLFSKGAFTAIINGAHNSFGWSFTFLISLSKSLTNNYLFFQFFLSIIDLFLIHILIKRYCPPFCYALTFLIFIVFWGINLEINLLRTIKCLLIFIFSIKYIEKRKPVKYFLLMIIAQGFHFSALVLFPLYFFIHKKISKQWVWIAVVIGVLLFLFQVPFLGSLLSMISPFLSDVYQQKVVLYTETIKANYELSFGFFERLTTFLIFFIPYNKWTKDNNTNVIFINIYILYFSTTLYFSEFGELMGRLSILFIISYWFLYPRILILFNRNAKVCFLLILLFFGTYRIFIDNKKYLYQYDNLLFGIEEKKQREQNLMKLNP